ncbi:MAG TPA: Clp protease N-terminal domain-containing protein [Abditibacteriaceae bacterium]|jgi:ATP-dependent Clp protease ATP-binding subunit ClpA
MWQRFTERARRVILLGQEEAGKMGSGHVGTEHLLLGLLTESEGVAAQILHKMDVTADFVRAAIEARVATQDRRGFDPKLTHEAKRVLELAADEARRMRHNYIGTEHLLLALLRERDDMAAEILLEVGLNLADMRQQVVEYLGTGVADEPVRKPGHLALKSQTQIDVSPGFHTLLSLAANKAHASGSDTVNLLHFLQVLLEPENQTEMTLLKECGLDVEKQLLELIQRLHADDANSAENS